MVPDHEGFIRDLLAAVRSLPQSQRAAYLEARCPDAEVRAEVEDRLRRADEADGGGDASVDAGRHHQDGSDATLPDGTSLSHYRIRYTLGAGGMGTVYLAHDERLDRDVAIKVLKAPHDRRARTRLLREARAAAGLDHPSICAVYDVGSDPHVGDFIVMALVEGDTLATRLVTGPLPPREAMQLGRQLAEALAVAHAHGIVHRDIKPQNIVIDRSGRPRLLDFGIARAIESHRETPTATTQLTDPLAIIGTPPYMSPEQVQGRPVDGRSDLFSLGSVLYECLTGARAFDGRTAADICGRIVHEHPARPSARRPSVPHDMDVLCMRLLAKEPSARFQSAAEAVGAMRLLETMTEPTPARRAWPPRLRALPRLATRGAAFVSSGAIITVLLATGWTDWVIRAPWRVERLAAAPDDARHWYEQGVDALRTGSYAGAVSRLEEAVRLFPQYVHAYSRIAEAYSELDNPRAADQALVRVSALVTNEAALDEDERLRLVAVRAAALRDHASATAAYAALVDRHPGDSGALVDLARAQDAAGQSLAARDTLQQAVGLNPLDAAAHLRLGVIESRLGQKDRALEALEESARLYRAAANLEGEAEALLRRGMVLNAVGELDAAQTALERVVALAVDPRYRVQRLRAQFELAAVASSHGQFTRGEQLARDAVDEATTLGLPTVAANGLIDLADTLIVAGRHEVADEQLDQAVALATTHGARRTAMRATLQKAAMREGPAPTQALTLAAEPLAFYEATGDARLAAVARTILSRAYQRMEDYERAATMAVEVLTFAETVRDDALAATALENLAGVRAAQGRLPEALAIRERIDEIHRAQGDHVSLPFDLVNRAEVLVRLGRGNDARALLDEFDVGIAEGHESYAGRGRRAAMVRALLAATEGRDADVLHSAAVAVGSGEPTRDSTAMMGAALMSYARARLGRPRANVEAQLERQDLQLPAHREVRYWMARGLAERGRVDEAVALIEPALAAGPVRQNAELRWRLAATALLATRGNSPRAPSWREAAVGALAQLTADWAAYADLYAQRADLAPLHALVR